MSEKHLVVIGSGPGGYVAALRAASNGIPTTLVEESRVGGVCLNVGCIPTKCFAATANLIAAAREGHKLGLKCDDASIDFDAARAHKESVISRLATGVESLLKNKGVQFLRGRGRLTSPRTVEIENAGEKSEIAATHVIIATGSTALKPSFFNFDGVKITTAEEMLSIKHVPGKLVVIGGGIIGTEFASIFNTFGSEVEIEEMLPEILSMLDVDLRKEMTRSFKKRKVKLHTGSKVTSVEKTGDKIKLALDGGAFLESDHVLVSIGRRPNSADLGLDEAGVETDERGFIKVDEYSRTSEDGIYAIGDVTGKWLLAHTASAQGVSAADHIAGKSNPVNEKVVPSCVFTNPELGSVGLTESEAQEKGYDYKTSKFLLRTLGKAQAMDELDGFVKIIGDQKTGKLLGMHVAGVGASIIIHEGAIALTKGATVEDIAHTIHAHPTLSEAVMEAAESYLGSPLHG